MATPKLSKLELQIMERLRNWGACSIRELQEEGKGAVRTVKRIGNTNIFAAAISGDDAERKLIDELLGLSGARTKPAMARLVESGKLTLEDVRETEQAIRNLARSKTSGREQR
jgi:BlaI family transcriptional regulator, penicillinase repressor